MILCVCPSPALDVTYHVGELVAGATVRVGSVAERPGGKAVNVARVLHALGEPVLLVAPAGGETGDRMHAGLDAAGVPSRLVPDRAATRRTVTVVEAGGRATCLTEPATSSCWPELVAAVEESLADARVVVVAGRLPEGIPARGLTALVTAARAAGVPVIADTHGAALVEALEAGCLVVKPNAEELAQVTDDQDPTRAARRLCDRYGVAVVVSRGHQGVVAATRSGTWEARPAAALSGNPTGAGDALVAGLAGALAHDHAALDHPEQTLRDAVALSVAAVRSPTAGELDLSGHAETRAAVAVRALDGVG
ncbi:MAG TPA: hexose kinase [Nocardioides sp.]|uniref:1-phosphofructokinase family hexose kinase n=1 Tax=Nocardioides sp. TaxID=35761 RepID=UPI002E2F1F01|nr:hexose kinase [Nocardioides sp.]HEX3929278.1 hexose kinase [Nocardioides sp.]